MSITAEAILETRRDIIKLLRLNHTLAEWEAAKGFLDHFGADAEAQVNCAIGFGLNATEADHLTYLVQALRKEGKDRE